MQSIRCNQNWIHPIFNDMSTLYSLMSDTNNSSGIIRPCLDESLIPIYDKFLENSDMSADIEFIDKQYGKFVLNGSTNTIIVCFSGGKDSFATAKHYIKLRYNVILYHVIGINRGYQGEYKSAQQCADYLGVPIFFESAVYTGTHCWVEHPMKNIILANMAVQFGLTHGYGCKIAFGSFSTACIADNVFSVCGGDCVDMWYAYESCMKHYIPKFKVYTPNKNYQTAFYMLKRNPDVLPLLRSCLTTNRFREQFHNRTSKNYSVELLPNRCGCCWKCAVEYIWCIDNGAYYKDVNVPYYIHCLEILAKTIHAETGTAPYRIRSVWDSYIFYPIQKSRVWGVLQFATISSKGKIKYPNDSTTR